MRCTASSSLVLNYEEQKQSSYMRCVALNTTKGIVSTNVEKLPNTLTHSLVIVEIFF